MTNAAITKDQAAAAATWIKETIESYRNDKIIMDFVTNEAREKVASEINKEIGGSTTAKGVDLLEARYPNIKRRVEEYVDAGLVGCFIASQS